jgi:tRNA-splicing ligase RtcB
MQKEQLIRHADYLWEIPVTARPGMRVPAHIYALEELLDALLRDRSLDQLMNVAMLPGIVKAAIVMPDAHEGYGFPIGGVAATRHPDGVISPGGIGYDINCGVRLLVSPLHYTDMRNRIGELSRALYAQIPSGVGQGGALRLTRQEMDAVLAEGARWAVHQGFGYRQDLEHMESYGCLMEADPSRVSEAARTRGLDQLGTIGAGNHFVEVDRVDELFDAETAAAFGLAHDQLVVLIHTGSRGLGHQVATDHLRVMVNAMAKYGIDPPDRELACVPFSSPEGQDYFGAMCAAANFAWCNREMITWEVRKAWSQVFGKSGGELSVLYDVAHNIAKIETHRVGESREKVIVHRKGATRAFGPGHPEIPAALRDAGQPVLIPGSMGTSSFVLVGTDKGMDATFGSTCHGAGRRLSRRAAQREVDAPQLQASLEARGIHIQAGSMKGIAEEAPAAYKDVDLVVETVHRAGIARKVARLRPVAVIKG